VTFTDPAFAILFGVVLLLYLPVAGRAWGLRAQNLLLLIVSAVFYGWVHPVWVALLYLSASVDYGAALAMERWPDRKRALLVVSLTCNLGLLAAFKYVGFFSANLQALGVPVPVVEVLLPAGISFYTFQSMSYTIDVYRGQLRACRDPVDYFVFISFFPQLVAGPIERASDLLAQVTAPRTVTAAGFGAGLMRATWGLAKKLVVADNVAVYVDRVYGLPALSAPLALAGAFAFSVQILADFSGYTDMARGVAQMMGFRLSPNFLHPYLAANPTELWQRWHVSLSGWIRDYLYIPLGGSRGGPARVAAVTVVTMGLSGLWHGASWNFVLWGLYHAALVLVYRQLWPLLKPLPRVVTVPVFFCLVVIGWAIFRQTDAAVLFATIRHPLPVAPAADAVVSAVVLAIGACGGAVLVLGLLVERWLLPRLTLPDRGALRVAFGAGLVSLVATLLVAWMRTNADTFIYFAF
jgi:D-alanyl-lipoteichoic acid acyltransferase DltB (MBOAT superfamily)